ncbi:podocalyxin [Polypterus senegalus]|uniref:podocalyxin n=1 Tax=Polypterus senegalus TaxID=55291 RepID=UPI001964A7DD|nr:podocalyxin [Polypterus senegalus]
MRVLLLFAVAFVGFCEITHVDVSNTTATSLSVNASSIHMPTVLSSNASETTKFSSTEKNVAATESTETTATTASSTSPTSLGSSRTTPQSSTSTKTSGTSVSNYSTESSISYTSLNTTFVVSTSLSTSTSTSTLMSTSEVIENSTKYSSTPEYATHSTRQYTTASTVMNTTPTTSNTMTTSSTSISSENKYKTDSGIECFKEEMSRENRSGITLKSTGSSNCEDFRLSETAHNLTRDLCSKLNGGNSCPCTLRLKEKSDQPNELIVLGVVTCIRIEDLKERFQQIDSSITGINITVAQLKKDDGNKPVNQTLIAILTSVGVLLLLLLGIISCTCYQRRNFGKKRHHLTEEMQTVENGYHDNPTLEVMEVQPEMQEKKANLNCEFNDSWIVPIDNFTKEDLDEEDTHL